MKPLFALLALLSLSAGQGIARDLASSPQNLVEAAQKAANTLDQTTASLVRAETASDRVRGCRRQTRPAQRASDPWRDQTGRGPRRSMVPSNVPHVLPFLSAAEIPERQNAGKQTGARKPLLIFK